MKSLMLDTDVCIEIIRGEGEALERYAGRRFLVSVVTHFELKSGLRKRKSRKLEERAGIPRKRHVPSFG